MYWTQRREITKFDVKNVRSRKSVFNLPAYLQKAKSSLSRKVSFSYESGVTEAAVVLARIVEAFATLAIAIRDLLLTSFAD